MGWLYMSGMGGHATPRSYLDNQFTYARDDHRLTVLASSIVGTTYYAACERLEANGDRQVFAIICLTSTSTGARDGMTFGYKDMSEDMGPHESACPAAILDELTETRSEHAQQWRTRCRANLELQKLQRAKPTPKPGQTILFDEPLCFSDGADRDRFTVVANPNGKAPLFRDPISGAVCKISKLKTRSYRLINPAIVPKDAANG